MIVADDVVIVGAGPSGLALACALADSHFRVAVIEQQPRTAIAAPAADGREIALTHRAIAILKSLGLWQRLAPESISPIRAAHVLDGQSPQVLGFDPGGSGLDALGYLVPNHLVRKAAYEALAERPSIRLLDGTQIEQLQMDTDPVRVGLADGTELRGCLLVAADSRFSGTRRQMGISAEHRDFGRSVIVCRLAHEAPANGIAYEFFGYGRTLAILPLNGHQVSAVVTVTGDHADALLRLPPEAFAASIRAQFPRLGALRISGERHAYPLVAVYADRFATDRGVLVGDAAVGMHPVTAHGFNLGLYGIDTLVRVLNGARLHGQSIGSLRVLRAYEREHRLASRALYLGTNALVSLYTDERPPARLLRGAALHIADRLPPLKSAITRQLTGRHASPFRLYRPAP